MTSGAPWRLVWALGVTEIVSWGSLYYAFSVLLLPMERDLAWDRSTLVGAFSLGMLCTGLGSWPAGALIDRYGGRTLMTVGSLAAAGLLALLAHTHSVLPFYLIWMGLGFAMAAVLYEPAFAVIYRSFREDGKKAVTALTLAAGFASTLFWPLTQVLVEPLGWRATVLVLALLNLGICLPLHALVLPSGRGPASGAPPRNLDRSGRAFLRARSFWLLAFAFTANMLAFSALSVHLIPLLRERGLSGAVAVTLAALVGPMQVAGRVVEYVLGRRVSVLDSGLVALALLPVGLLLLLFGGANLTLLAVALLLYGASNGVMTIVRAAVPAELFDREQYGSINGALAAPVIMSRAVAPIAASWLWTPQQGYRAVLWALALTAVLAVVCFYWSARGKRSA
ncbi:MAG TPA: MFS transporter [Burkholderiales bacterium]|nr:MFS transporter [Burkholderiales bacterium]